MTKLKRLTFFWNGGSISFVFSREPTAAQCNNLDPNNCYRLTLKEKSNPSFL